MHAKGPFGYTVIFEPAPEGGYVAFVPALSGCMSEGDTFEEAKTNIQDAIAGYLGVLLEDHAEIPRETGEFLVTRVIAPDPA